MTKFLKKILDFVKKYNKSPAIIGAILDFSLIVLILSYFYDISPIVEAVQSGSSISSDDAISFWGFGIFVPILFSSFHSFCTFLVSLIPKKKNNRISSENSD